MRCRLSQKRVTRLSILVFYIYKKRIQRCQRGKQKSSEDRQYHGQQNETKDKHRTNKHTLKTKAGVTRTLQKPG